MPHERDAAAGLRLMCVGMLLLYSHVQLCACCSGEPVSCRPNHRRGFAKLYILFEEKKKKKTNKKKRCMRIRCLQKTKVKGCCHFSPSEMEEREVLMSIILD